MLLHNVLYKSFSIQSSLSTKEIYSPVAISKPVFLADDNPPFSLFITFILESDKYFSIILIELSFVPSLTKITSKLS